MLGSGQPNDRPIRGAVAGWPTVPPGRAEGWPPRGFTLVELLVVLALIGILAALVLPVFSPARERARVTQVSLDLRQIELALEMYHEDTATYPPVRVSCNTDERSHWCQLPIELVAAGYLPPANRRVLSSAMRDPFNPGHTYKYAAVVPYLLNGSPQSERFAVFIPDDFPDGRNPEGRYRDDALAPLDWVVWSLGPRATRAKGLHPRAPVSGATWYRQPGDEGIIGRIKPRDAMAFQTL